MELWLVLVLGGQLLNAIVALVDKHLVTSKAVSKPIVYAFYIGFLSIFAIIFLPFGVVLMPTVAVIVISLTIAVSYVISIIFLYKALAISRASETIPVIGAVTALSALFFAFIILYDKLPHNFLIAFSLLVIGMLLLSHMRFNMKTFGYILISGVMFGLSNVFIKMSFSYTTPLNSLFWSRMANVLVVLMLLLWPGIYKAVAHNTRHTKKKTAVMVIGNKALAGIAFIMIYFATRLGNVSLVTALSGMQFFFVLFLAIALAKVFPEYLHEDIKKHELWHKITAITIIVIGFGLLFV